jgi:hypothetical protein
LHPKRPKSNKFPQKPTKPLFSPFLPHFFTPSGDNSLFAPHKFPKQTNKEKNHSNPQAKQKKAERTIRLSAFC